jgi:hypothetical protein
MVIADRLESLPQKETSDPIEGIGIRSEMNAYRAKPPMEFER